MGVPYPIIFIIVMMMSMFAAAAFILYKKRDIFTSPQTIDKIPSNTYKEQEDQS